MDELDKTAFTERLTRFLEAVPGRHGPSEPIRLGIFDVLHRATSRPWKTFIVGGALRDLCLGPPGSLPRDIDVVVDGPSSNELEDVFRDLLVRRNSFGGLRLQQDIHLEDHNRVNYVLLFDIWCLQDSWGIKTQGIQPTIPNFLRTPFLNIDSIAVALSGEKELHVYENGFFKAVREKTLEINNEPNPFPFVCVIRSLLLAVKLDFEIGPRLALFIYSLMATAPVSELIEAQISHYGRVRFGEDDIKMLLSKLRAELERGRKKVRLGSSPRCQRLLWEDRHPYAECNPAGSSFGSPYERIKHRD